MPLPQPPIRKNTLETPPKGQDRTPRPLSEIVKGKEVKSKDKNESKVEDESKDKDNNKDKDNSEEEDNKEIEELKEEIEELEIKVKGVI